MKRREFITILGSATVAWPMLAEAQRSSSPVIGYLGSQSPESYAPYVAALSEGLKATGYIAGQNVTIEYRWAEGHNDRLPGLAAELVRRRVNAIIATGGGPSALAAKGATTTIPIVFTIGADPVAIGLVAGLNRPGGNVTGVTNITPALAAKRLELLHQLVPAVRMVGVLINSDGLGAKPQQQALQEAASVLGLQVTFFNAGSEREIQMAFTTLPQQGAGAMLLTDNAFFNGRREQIVTLAARRAIPMIHTFREFAAAGGLMSYASNLTDHQYQAGIYVGRILKGEKPSDLPVLQPTKFDLVINLKTAKALGLAIPPTLLALANEVIE